MPLRAVDRLRAIPPRRSFAVAVATLILFLAAAFIEVTIILERPAVGDISSELTTLIEYSSGSISTLSGLLTIYNATQDKKPESTNGPTDSFVVEGDMHGDVHLSLGDLTHNQSPEEPEPDPDEITLSESAPTDEENTPSDPSTNVTRD